MESGLDGFGPMLRGLHEAGVLLVPVLEDVDCVLPVERALSPVLDAAGSTLDCCWAERPAFGTFVFPWLVDCCSSSSKLQR